MADKLFTHVLQADGDSLVLRLEFEESRYPFLLSVTSLLYDLELTYDLATLLSYRQYGWYSFSNRFWYRHGRPLQPEHRLRTVTIVKQSPLLLEVVAAAGGIWALIQAFEKVSNWKWNKQKLQLEVQKLEKENVLKEVEIIRAADEFQQRLTYRHADHHFDQLRQRLEASPIRLRQLSVRAAENDGSNRPDADDGSNKPDA